MPIKRLQKQGPPQFPCIGKLRKGGEKPATGKAPGKDLDYFRFTSDDQRALTMFEAAYGKEPDTINVFLPFATTDENFSAWQEAWLSGGLQHRCDGDTCSIWYDQQAATYRHEPKPCPGGCKEVGRLMVIVPELQRLAYVTVETHSVNDIMMIDENLRAVESTAGILSGIPFVLKRRIREISTPNPKGKSGRTRRPKSLLSIEVSPEWASQKLVAMHTAAISGPVVDDAYLLQEPEFDDADDDVIEVLAVAANGAQPEQQADEFFDDKDSTFVMHPGGITPVNEFVATHTAPADDAATSREQETLDLWADMQPPAIQKWTVENELSTNGNSAQTAWMNAVKANGGYSKKNAKAVKLAYLRERMAKHGQPEKVTA